MSDLAVISQPGALEAASTAQVLAWCEQGHRALDNAAALVDAKGILDVADTLSHAVRLRDMNSESIIAASRLKLLAERRVGELIAAERAAEKLASNGGRRHLRPVSVDDNDTDSGDVADGSRIATLADHGITRDEASAYSKLAAAPIDVFEATLDAVADDAADRKVGITRTAVLRKLDPVAERRPDEWLLAFEKAIDTADRAQAALHAELDNGLRFGRAHADHPWPEASLAHARRTLDVLAVTVSAFRKALDHAS